MNRLIIASVIVILLVIMCTGCTTTRVVVSPAVAYQPVIVEPAVEVLQPMYTVTERTVTTTTIY